tara:strand:+ start:402 stop:728 length:327 start_codon:yes stop_codon:yes gene_type:complete
MTLVHESDIQDKVENELEWELQDYGIGRYDFGDGNFIDKKLDIALQDNQFTVHYTVEPEQFIFTMIQGTKTIHTDVDEYEFSYMAELMECIWNDKKKAWAAMYEVSEQ